MINKFISKIYIKYFTRNVLYENELDYNEQLQILNSIKEPLNDFERTYYQNYCQMKRANLFFKLGINLISMITFPFFAFFYLIKGTISKTYHSPNEDCILFLSCSNGKAIYPKELEEVYSNVVEVDFLQDKMLKLSDLFFALRFVVKYPFSAWLSLRILYRVAVYRYVINKHNPNAIVRTMETSPSSSVLTYYCELNNIEHINILSGERFFEISTSFVHFHKFYVWDEHYIKIFMKLRADKQTNFIIHTPNALKIDLYKNRIENKIVDFTYYLGVFTEKEIEKISDIVEKISSLGYSIRLRPHLRWTDMNLLRKYISEYYIEDNNEMSIEESIASTNVVIGVSTTVLLQSLKSGREIMIDDVVYLNTYNNLKKKDYIVYSKPHIRLSDFINSQEKNN